MRHIVEWNSASPLWEEAVKDSTNTRFKQPALLRFASDAFMEDLEDVLQNNPAALQDLVANYETGQEEGTGWLPEGNPLLAKPLKLYQPVHGRFYLVAASLVCRLQGLPDKPVDTANEEKVAFVMRRLVARKEGRQQVDPKNSQTYFEYGWVVAKPLCSAAVKLQSDLDSKSIPAEIRRALQNSGWSLSENATVSVKRTGGEWLITDANSQRTYTVKKEGNTLNVYLGHKGNRWQKIDPSENVERDEERHPLFAMNFQEGGRQRRLLAGFIPVASRENYQAAPELSPLKASRDDLQDDALADPRLAQFEAGIAAAMKGLRDRINPSLSTPPPPNVISKKEAREVFVFILLDLAAFLQEHLKEVWNAIVAQQWSGAADQKKSLFDKLHTTTFYDGKHWDDALRDIAGNKASILSGSLRDSPPSMTLITANLTRQAIRDLIQNLNILDVTYQNPSSFNSLVKNALGRYIRPQEAQDPLEVPKLDPSAGAFYVIRCVYERPHCKGIHPPVVSREPSQPFQLAPFFDPEAPARPLRITMPIDTSIEGLRKFPKNVSFLISQKLRQQMERVQGVNLEDLDDGDIHDEPSLDLGMICSLSIPIVTICALILLMIIVQLLNIVFWWLPFFKICLPLNLKSR